MAEYKPGNMDIRDQERTFNGFVRFVTVSVIVIICFLVFLALVGG
ncbi:cytochrome C oxidase subunit IV [Thioclava sediminum]|uniref:Cytochrome C oxidase subunit IV n=1 Tax=Thioclava sediminum TaxID=1915319 RepID=A0ABX3N1V0_9RHOB|nr:MULTISPECIES: aa3-type cytochrome c oxidase subunit IV [Thioclava]MAQ35902.1 aa3-type cytochrome c oxidase subunit IV [Thioclava sp.]MPQ95203.1 aa3-type cytochrome c oxidase subunit IV [Thioclava sp. JE_KL1]OOY07949.1 cytochrome C oxidase subunit IV [Thioclava sp. F36-7]OOY15117.1 cytochrome C oxidase subunit IV [Thioclava sp. DLFJ4-1]OOY25919.1 cytochrome C oxidase subunit IV [Thioclava sediminum]|tara:strand:- start:1068 stop:1202 length:135 start_codon:yes stop_codon:yes gene_type:complete